MKSILHHSLLCFAAQSEPNILTLTAFDSIRCQPHAPFNGHFSYTPR